MKRRLDHSKKGTNKERGKNPAVKDSDGGMDSLTKLQLAILGGQKKETAELITKFANEGGVFFSKSQSRDKHLMLDTVSGYKSGYSSGNPEDEALRGKLDRRIILHVCGKTENSRPVKIDLMGLFTFLGGVIDEKVLIKTILKKNCKVEPEKVNDHYNFLTATKIVCQQNLKATESLFREVEIWVLRCWLRDTENILHLESLAFDRPECSWSDYKDALRLVVKKFADLGWDDRKVGEEFLVVLKEYLKGKDIYLSTVAALSLVRCFNGDNYTQKIRDSVLFENMQRLWTLAEKCTFVRNSFDEHGLSLEYMILGHIYRTLISGDMKHLVKEFIDDRAKEMIAWGYPVSAIKMMTFFHPNDYLRDRVVLLIIKAFADSYSVREYGVAAALCQKYLIDLSEADIERRLLSDNHFREDVLATRSLAVKIFEQMASVTELALKLKLPIAFREMSFLTSSLGHPNCQQPSGVSLVLNPFLK